MILNQVVAVIQVVILVQVIQAVIQVLNEYFYRMHL
jgi:hypothetical protein